MRALTPWTGLSTLRHEMDRLFDRLWEGEFPTLPMAGEWTPALDLSETKDALMVKAEIPGIEPKEIEVSLQGEVLTIKGEKEEEREEKDKHYYRKERTYGAFARSLRLPVAVDGSKVTATFKNGLLTITLPKAPAAKGTTIPVKTE
ncbi:MAG: Hsp20/alpha crystallin family protein [Candidatus Rokubacteria bacterium]|nr:Hsp20/alpha crystallin family protein [Candidatus Rokubacteria bacterium]